MIRSSVACPLSSSIMPNGGRSKSAAVTGDRSGREPVETDPLPHRPQIDPLKHHRQLRRAQFQPWLLVARDRRRPLKTSSLQSLRPDAKTRAVPVQDLHHVPTAVEEHKQMARGRLLPEHRFGQRYQAGKALPHVRRVFGEVHLGVERGGNHVTAPPMHPPTRRSSPGCDPTRSGRRSPEHESRAHADEPPRSGPRRKTGDPRAGNQSRPPGHRDREPAHLLRHEPVCPPSYEPVCPPCHEPACPSPCSPDVRPGLDCVGASFAAPNASAARRALPARKTAGLPAPPPQTPEPPPANTAPSPHRVTSPSSQPLSFRWNSGKPRLSGYHPTQDALVAAVTIGPPQRFLKVALGPSQIARQEPLLGFVELSNRFRVVVDVFPGKAIPRRLTDSVAGIRRREDQRGLVRPPRRAAVANDRFHQLGCC